MTWTWRVEAVKDGEVVSVEERAVVTGPPFGLLNEEDEAFKALNLPASDLKSKSYVRATLLRRS